MKKVKLDELQLKIMRVLWQKDEATVVQIREALHRNYAVTTIGTILTRLKKRNIVDYKKHGRQYVYRPLITEDTVQSSMVNTLVEQLFEGNSSNLVNHLLKQSEFDATQLEELRSLIDQHLND